MLSQYKSLVNANVTVGSSLNYINYHSGVSRVGLSGGFQLS